MSEAIQDGISQLTWADNFAYAERWDEKDQKYLGLKAGEAGSVHLDDHSVIIKPEVARAQMNAERPPETEQPSDESSPTDKSDPKPGEKPGETPARERPKRFFGSVKLDALRISRDVGDISQEVIQHLNSLIGAELEISMEISAKIPEGIPENVERTVNENCQTLKFNQFGFEEE